MIKNVHYERKFSNNIQIDILEIEEAKKVRKFHESFPMYAETPLVELGELAKYLGINGIYVKDESYRFGLNAFKVLGGSYAIGKYLSGLMGKDIEDLPYEKMISDEVKSQLGEITFISATDGNHGRGVAFTAKQLKQKSIILMPKGSSEERLRNIQAEGAEASITDLNYDDAVRLAYKMAMEKGYVMVQDTAWEGYEDIPTWIMQGYMTMAYEAYEQLKNDVPTHIFIQAGVGSLAGAVIGFFTSVYKEKRPIMIVVEPDNSACIYESARAGERRIVGGDLSTIMAGLACGEPNTISWEILKNYGDNFISCPDYIAAQGMRIMGNPIGNDRRIISGESGAPGLGLVSELLLNDKYAELKEVLKLNKDSIILFFSTEGDTDKDNYRKIVWDGAYPSVR
jgi:diaminopropionate ammonia-lyase